MAIYESKLISQPSRRIVINNRFSRQAQKKAQEIREAIAPKPKGMMLLDLISTNTTQSKSCRYTIKCKQAKMYSLVNLSEQLNSDHYNVHGSSSTTLTSR
ncbi:hypothetical protein LWI29_031207 [Acer saccharum]|uniref:Uncharacterized protein n=1 Tax=Acer saccharum TaxID=4024 RepID=A0AA39SFF9_ACESA|nr:hypothetical protein LWI29_031207 [Acer saccharum]